MISSALPTSPELSHIYIRSWVKGHGDSLSIYSRLLFVSRAAMVLDLLLFRPDQGGDIDKLKELQKKRFKNVTHVDKVVDADTQWRKCKF